MPESIEVRGATDAPDYPVPDASLTIYETDQLNIWSVQSNHLHSLEDYFLGTFNAEPQIGRMFFSDEWRLIQISPNRAFLISEQSTPLQSTTNYKTMLTDVSHGYCELCLSGEFSFDFVGLYISVDLNKALIRGKDNLRCRFGQYSCLLYWDNSDQVRVLIERSYARSFRNYLDHLLKRHDLTTSLKTNPLINKKYDD
jgi:sarcosine oxidase gamma subunit